MKLRKITIKRFRGIEEQTIENIDNTLVFIGKNNAGKSAFITAVRILFNDYNPQNKDIYKGNDDFEIEGVFECDDYYLYDFVLDKKIGIAKIPSNTTEYNTEKDGTEFENISFTEFKNLRQELIDNGQIGDIGTQDRFCPLWLKVIKSKFNISDGEVVISLVYKRDGKIEYISNKDLVALLPQIAFINDTRNFDEEESGKSKTITYNIFNHILNNDIFSETNNVTCENCSHENCEDICINEISTKRPSELSVDELQKLINFKTKNSSAQITNSISERFSENYQQGFKVNIKATSSIDKSFSISTKIFDPLLNAEVDLSNVGAGIRSIYILSLLQSYQAINAKHTIFAIEEPELYLHPELQKSMAKTLSKIAKNNQVFFTTHSPIMLREFSKNDIRKIKLDEENYCTISENAEIEDILNEIGYSTQDILNTDFVLFVEGPDDKTIYGKLIEKNYNIDMERISIIDTKSCNNIGFYATLRFLEKTTMSNDFAIIRDSDTALHSIVMQSLSNKLNSNLSPDFVRTVLDKIHITEYSSVEGYLFSPNLLVEHGIFESEDVVYNVIKQELAEKKDKCINYFKNRNQGEQNRIDTFTDEYDEKVLNINNNLNWMKKNIQGHTYFGFTRSKSISYEDYLNELPEGTFSEIIAFLDSIDYFYDKKIDNE